MILAKAYFLLPLKDNHDRDLAPDIAKVRAELYAHFTGWSFEGFVEGAYQMADGTLAVDHTAKYMVFLEESRIGELEQLLLEFKGKTGQEKIFLEIQHNVDIRLL
jgi:hypothetical protein